MLSVKEVVSIKAQSRTSGVQASSNTGGKPYITVSHFDWSYREKSDLPDLAWMYLYAY